MHRRVTIFGEPLASWADEMVKAALSTAAARPGEARAHTQACVLTYPQIIQLCLTVKPHRLWSVAVPEEALEYTLHQEVARATLVHSQRVRKLHVNRGDALVGVDITAPVLSARGVALTNDASTLNKMKALANERNYHSPFWLTCEELEYFIFSHNRLRKLFNCNIPPPTLGGLDAYKAIPSIEVESERGQKCNVMNLSEFAGITSSTLVSSSSTTTTTTTATDTNTGVSRKGRCLNHQTAFHMFRQFRPVNILTKSPFPPVIEDALRKYSMVFGCWCTVWGTPEAYRSLGIKIHDGALGVWVFDAEDSPLFLTTALSCNNPVEALAHVYDADHIILVTP